MANDLVLRKSDLVQNPTARVPICLVLDRSPSMSGDLDYGSAVEQTNPRPIDELNDGVRRFINALKEDEVVRRLVWKAISARWRPFPAAACIHRRIEFRFCEASLKVGPEGAAACRHGD